VNQRIAILRNQDCIENGYLKHLLVNGTFETYCFKNGTGPQNNISKAQLLRYRIPLPPLPIQQEIVRILDTFTNLTAELTNKLNAELTARRKQYEYYRDELLTFGEDVEYKKLGEVVSMKAGKAIKAQDIGEKNELFSIPCYGGNGLRGYVKDANCSGDKVLIGRQGALCGNVCFVSGEFYATEHAVVVSSDNNVDMRFLFHLLLKLNLNQYKTAGAQPGLSVSKLETVKVQIPSIEYQRRVSKVLDLFSRYIDNLEDGLPAEISARQKQYEYYRDQLLSFQKEKE
jgi:type I restriction enzyme S subunit